MDKKLMKLFLECPNAVREVILSDNQISILRSINDSVFKYITTRQLADMKCCSIQLASTMLGRLYRKGYLDRVERVSKTGGIEYLYKCSVKFN